MKISDNKATDLQDEKIGPNIFEKYRKEVTKRMKFDKDIDTLGFYFSSINQDFDSFLRTEIDLVEKDFRFVLNKNNSNFITNELELGIYTFKDLSEALFRILQPEYELFNNSIDIEIDDITKKTQLVVRPGILAIRFDENSYFINVLGFNYGWDYKYYNDYTSQKTVNSSTTHKIHIKTNVVDGSIVNSSKQPILYSLVLHKPSDCKVFCEPETFLHK